MGLLLGIGSMSETRHRTSRRALAKLVAAGAPQLLLGLRYWLLPTAARVGVYAKPWQVKQEKRKLASSCWHTELAILQSSVLFALHSLYRGLDNSRATMGSPKMEAEQTESNRQFGENCNTPTR
ncbi:hypothetical protein ACKLNR_012045 [Fusarium oxysporum f. sp. zingiberi]